MKRRWALLIGLLALEHAAFVGSTVSWSPEGDRAAMVSMAWILVTALTATIVCCPYRAEGWAALISGPITGAAIAYLQLAHGQLKTGGLEHPAALAASRIVGGVLLSAIAGAFVHVIASAVMRSRKTNLRGRLAIATRKGLTYSFLCVGLTAPILFWLMPRASGRANPHHDAFRLQFVLTYAMAGIALGVLIGVLVGISMAFGFQERDGPFGHSASEPPS
jgi:hypothetical protein